ncbi:hypothetical protein EGW08_021069, partial [Elysia chlorotica]
MEMVPKNLFCVLSGPYPVTFLFLFLLSGPHSLEFVGILQFASAVSQTRITEETTVFPEESTFVSFDLGSEIETNSFDFDVADVKGKSNSRAKVKFKGEETEPTLISNISVSVTPLSTHLKHRNLPVADFNDEKGGTQTKPLEVTNSASESTLALITQDIHSASNSRLPPAAQLRMLETNNVSGEYSQDDDSFNLFFKTNTAEMMNVPITFSKPLPEWVNGTLIRNGLGKFENGPRKFLHAFDGFAKLASWRFMGNETALFSTRFIRSAFYKESMKTKTIAPYLLFQAVSPPFSYYEKLKCLMRGIDNMNVNIYAFKNPKNKNTEYAVLSDFWIIYKVSLQKLSTKHRVVPRIKKGSHSVASMGGLGFLNLLSSAHPLPEPGTDNHLNFLSSVSFVPWGNHMMKLMRFKSLKRRRVVAQWPVPSVPYMHSFSVTRTKAILLASPFYVNVMCMARKAQPFSCLDWYPNKPAKLFVVDLKSGNLTTITMETVFTMHHVNAYDVSKTEIVMDISTYPNPDFVSHLQLHVLMDPVARNSFDAHAKLQRITINLDKGEAHLAPVDSRPEPGLASMLDMPVINEAYRSRHYCYVYGLVLKADNKTLSSIAIVKKDLCSSDGHGGGVGDRVWILPHCYPVEPWFVANPRAAAEDDGLLLVPVIDGVKKVSTLVVLDARTMSVVSS